jgi:uncharacterized protein (DUF1697 family)
VRHVALLRGINVGGKHRVAMADLVRHFEALGARDVTTFIQSGNVVFDAPAKVAATIRRTGGAHLEAALGFPVPVVLRTAAELAAVVATTPHGDQPEDHRHVAFLGEAPDDARARAVESFRPVPDSFIHRGRELYLLVPGGMARTKLTCAYFDRTFATVSTMRNWRTVVAIGQLLVR